RKQLQLTTQTTMARIEELLGFKYTPKKKITNTTQKQKKPQQKTKKKKKSPHPHLLFFLNPIIFMI
ncbi:hypothetical protein ACFW1P_00195, partial [Paenibacillus sp. NPDC058910]|uniref:hypothetical protein n=1 Tax=Paenibacillus sp. NPDC058910 TaxID=3346670 RepID=UPI0036C3E6EA